MYYHPNIKVGGALRHPISYRQNIEPTRCLTHPTAYADDLYRYLNFDQIVGFEDEGRVIPLEEMPRIEDILGMPTGAST